MFVTRVRPMSQSLRSSSSHDHTHILSRTFTTSLCTSHLRIPRRKLESTHISSSTPTSTSTSTPTSLSRFPLISTYTTLCSSFPCLSSTSTSTSTSLMSSPSSLSSFPRHLSTIAQLMSGCRKPRRYKNKRRYLEGSPQRKATVLKVFTMTPRKPNSAIRKVARIGIIGKRQKTTKVRPIWRITAYIPGAGHTLVKHNSVLVRGGRTVDLPGLKYKLIRGATGSGRIKNRKKRARYDLPAVLGLKNARSKYGVKRVKE